MAERGGACGIVFVSFHSEALVAPLAAEYRVAGHVVRIVDNSGTYVGDADDVVRPGANVGFGQACNLGVAALPPHVRAVCFHNPDVDPALDAVERARSLLATSPDVVAVAPTERSGGVPRSRGYAYPSPHREAYLALRLRIRHARREPPRHPRSPPDARVPEPPGPPGPPASLPRRFPAFAVVVVDRDAFEAVGGFDESYFLYVEDLDLWHRLQVHGGRCLFDRATVIDHRIGTSSPTSALSREVLRWVGVEVFASRFTRTGWRPFRIVHRAVARAYPPSPLLAEVRSLWRRGAAPDDVAAALRSKVEAGELSLA